MIREAELFVQADRLAVAVFGAVEGDGWSALLPPVFDMPGADAPRPVRAAVNHYAYDDAWVPDLLAGRTMDEAGRDRYDGDLLGDDPRAAVEAISAAAVAAAAQVTDPKAVVHCSYGDCPADDYLWQLNIARTLGSYDVAALLGLPWPIPEDLARGMVEGTEPAQELWRSFGAYRTPVPVDAGAPWRDRFLALTGRPPR